MGVDHLTLTVKIPRPWTLLCIIVHLRENISSLLIFSSRSAYIKHLNGWSCAVDFLHNGIMRSTGSAINPENSMIIIINNTICLVVLIRDKPRKTKKSVILEFICEGVNDDNANGFFCGTGERHRRHDHSVQLTKWQNRSSARDENMSRAIANIKRSKMISITILESIWVRV